MAFRRAHYDRNIGSHRSAALEEEVVAGMKAEEEEGEEERAGSTAAAATTTTATAAAAAVNTSAAPLAAAEPAMAAAVSNGRWPVGAVTGSASPTSHRGVGHRLCTWPYAVTAAAAPAAAVRPSNHHHHHGHGIQSVLPFTPMTVAFHDIRYTVTLPKHMGGGTRVLLQVGRICMY